MIDDVLTGWRGTDPGFDLRPLEVTGRLSRIGPLLARTTIFDPPPLRRPVTRLEKNSPPLPSDALRLDISFSRGSTVTRPFNASN